MTLETITFLGRVGQYNYPRNKYCIEDLRVKGSSKKGKYAWIKDFELDLEEGQLIEFKAQIIDCKNQIGFKIVPLKTLVLRNKERPITTSDLASKSFKSKVGKVPWNTEPSVLSPCQTYFF